MLPYASISEAAAVLSHNLTFAEILWFNYFATKFLHNNWGDKKIHGVHHE
ncbi:hypothetical protein JHK86_033710 [Glycine max]|nr:hypothetical protein JHK86_033710 [Glycine max]